MLSVAIITFNEADRISAAIKSVSFADEILVLDSGSTDATVEIAKKLGARVLSTDWPGHVEQKNRALQMVEGEWVLHVDADERVSKELSEEILGIINQDSQHVAFRVKRQNWWEGKPVRFGRWGFDRPIRLLKKSSGNWVGEDPHDRLDIDGKVGKLSGLLVHHPYRNLKEHWSTVDRYTELAALSAHERGRRSTVLDIFFRPPAHFFSSYLLLFGFLDGLRGLCLAWIGSVYVLLKWWRLRKFNRGQD